MKITFPHFGDAHLIARLFFQEIGVELIRPPVNSRRGLEIGSQNSPDEICLPFKLMLNNLMEAHEMGADTVIMVSTMGPCRLGEYGELLKSVLDKKGYHFEWILLDTVSAVGKKEIIRRLSQVVQDSNKSNLYILQSLKGMYRIICELEKLEKRAYMTCGYELNKGDCKKILTACKKELNNASSLQEALAIIDSKDYELKRIPVNKDKEPLKLLLTGEIYSLTEPFASHNIENLLMDMGVCFEKKITIGWWIRNTLLNPLQLRNIRERGNHYLPYSIGGYAKETVRDVVNSKAESFDGVIQIFPVGCMPEIVAKSVLSQITEELDIKVLTVIFDEMGGEAGYITRVEAFVDMLLRRKRLLKANTKRAYGGSRNVLHGN
ncbi:MAG: hypothetical protein ACOX5F_07790 [Anaerovoracaceae bacterium]|jgi:predicted nucleotide-binding protein (sugar kinase/HSP70/actin superfamily)